LNLGLLAAAEQRALEKRLVWKTGLPEYYSPPELVPALKKLMQEARLAGDYSPLELLAEGHSRMVVLPAL
jgi:hypothetical protein